MYQNIINPVNGKSVSVNSIKGKEIIRHYITHLQGGSRLNKLQKDLKKLDKKRAKIIKEMIQITSGGADGEVVADVDVIIDLSGAVVAIEPPRLVRIGGPLLDVVDVPEESPRSVTDHPTFQYE
tara:strand:+ start:411 stop:782 length:372 start_codon:yes stop_codon:yes gene_type:complete